ncbi:hypothetical protein FEO99_05758 [Burkholderia multivorans]|nr:hypothetical protein [Burkholderia multivorans]
MHKLELHVERQARRNPVRVELVGRQPFRLEEDLVRFLRSESMNLVLDRRAVARPHAFDHARVHRRTVETAANDVVRALVRVRDPARQLLRMLLGTAEEREHRNRIEIARLLFELREIDRAAVDTRRRSGLQPALRQLQLLQARRQRHGGRVARATARIVVQTDVDLAVQECTGRQHDRARAEPDADLRDGADHAIALDHQVVDGLLEQPQIRLILEAATDRRLVQDAVRLGACRAYGRAFRRIQDPELDPRFVGGGRHRAAQRIDFLDQMALADAADRRIAAHLPERFDVVGQQQRLRAHSGGRQRGFRAGMTAADDDDVKFCGIKHGGFRTQDRARTYLRNVWGEL